VRADGRDPWTRLVVGIVILTAGLIFWLDQIDRIDARDFARWWPLALIAIGLSHLPRRRWLAAAVWSGLGIAFLVESSGWGVIRTIIAIWPLLITAGGVTLIAHALRAPRNGGAFRAAAVMAGNNRTIGSAEFSGGQAVAVMAGCEIDLTRAQLKGNEATIDVLAFWGGIDIRVPAGWQVVSHVTEILGAVEDKTAPAGENAPRLVLRGSAIMGGVEVRNP
jgi:hypothetical protein